MRTTSHIHVLVSGRSFGLPETGFLRKHERNVRVGVVNCPDFLLSL